MEALPAAFEGLNKFNQFILYKMTPRPGSKRKMNKTPINWQTTHNHNAHDQAIWMNANDAIIRSNLFGEDYGVGFVLTDNDPFFLLDIDNCIDESGNKSAIANELINSCPGIAIETSLSGKGLHLIGSGDLPYVHQRNAEFGVELYTAAQFIALTGKETSGSVLCNSTSPMLGIINKYFDQPNQQSRSTNFKKSWEQLVQNGQNPSWRGPDSDEELLQLALRGHSSESVFGDRSSFRDLWEKNTDKLERAFPDSGHDCGYDESKADAALAYRLAYWTGNDAERILNLMWQSALVREKWDRPDYLYRTIANACNFQKHIFQAYENNAQNPAPTSDDTSLDWKTVSISDVLTNPPQPPEFIIEDLVPSGLLTLISAHGGSGKSMLALITAMHAAIGRRFLGKSVKHSRVVFFSGEDDERILRFRIATICRVYEMDPKEVEKNLLIVDSSSNPCLYEEQSSRHDVTAGYHKLADIISSFDANLLIIDNASDTFNANENNRSQVRGFIRSLVKIAKHRKITTILLSHTDKNRTTGGRKNESYSGSTQWHNSARSRLFLESEDDCPTVTLKQEKSNHGKKSDDIKMSWSSEHILIFTNNAPAQDNEETLSALLSVIENRFNMGKYLSAMDGAHASALKVLKHEPGFPSSIKRHYQLTASLNKLERDGKILTEEYKDKSRNLKVRYTPASAASPPR